MCRTTKDALSSDLLFLLLTEKGERYYQPDFGTNLLRFIFEMNDDVTLPDIEDDIRSTVSKYLPTIKISKMTFNREVDSQGNSLGDNELNVNIKFTYSEGVFTENGEIDLNF
jgi:phage baseplate assembly protein W